MATALHPWIDRWRLLAIGRGALPSLRGWLQLSGLERLERARARGRGVLLLASHTGGSLVVPRVLARMGFEVLSLEGSRPRGEVGGWWLDRLTVVPVNSKVFLPRAVLETQRLLERGGIAFLAPDGLVHRNGGVVVPFLGRPRRFASGFAQMAIATGAAALPVQASFDDDGRMQIEILDPLDAGVDTMSRRERVELLVRQYVRLVEASWAQYPGSAPAKYLDLVLEKLNPSGVREAPDAARGSAHGS